MISENKKINTAIIATPFIMIIASFIGFAIALIYSIWPIDQISLSNAGSTGDSFGILNTLFSGLGLASLVVALAYQQAQIKIQRQELNITQEELRKQSQLFDQQKFDDFFFQLLKIFRENLNSMLQKDKKTGEITKGVDLLADRLSRMRNAMKTAALGQFPKDQDDRIIYFWDLWNISIQSLGRQSRYIETLSSLIEWVDESCPSHIDKKIYWNIIASQFTYVEQSYLFYQVMFSSESHTLKKKFSIENPIFKKISRSQTNKNLKDIFAWRMSVGANKIKPALYANIPIDRKLVSIAKKNKVKAKKQY